MKKQPEKGLPKVPPAGESPKDSRPKGTNNSGSPLEREQLQTRHNVIGVGLRRIFDEVVEEPVPPEFLELLDQIDRKSDL